MENWSRVKLQQNRTWMDRINRIIQFGLHPVHPCLKSSPPPFFPNPPNDVAHIAMDLTGSAIAKKPPLPPAAIKARIGLSIND